KHSAQFSVTETLSCASSPLSSVRFAVPLACGGGGGGGLGSKGPERPTSSLFAPVCTYTHTTSGPSSPNRLTVSVSVTVPGPSRNGPCCTHPRPVASHSDGHAVLAAYTLASPNQKHPAHSSVTETSNINSSPLNSVRVALPVAAFATAGAAA